MIDIIGLLLAAVIGGGILKVLNDIKYELGMLSAVVKIHDADIKELKAQREKQS